MWRPFPRPDLHEVPSAPPSPASEPSVRGAGPGPVVLVLMRCWVPRKHYRTGPWEPWIASIRKIKELKIWHTRAANEQGSVLSSPLTTNTLRFVLRSIQSWTPVVLILSRFDSCWFSRGVLGLKNEKYSPLFFLLTRKLYLKWSKSLCSFTAWVRIETGLDQNDRFPSFLHSFFKRIFWTYLFFYLLESLLQSARFIFCLTVLRLRRGLGTLDLRGFLFMFGQFKAQCTPVHFCWVKPLSKAQDVTLKCAYCPLFEKICI